MARPLTLARLLLRTSPSLLAAAVASSLAAGLIGIGLIASAGAALRHLDQPGSALRYLGLCALLYGCELLSRMVLVRLGQRAIFDLREHLVRRVLASSLRQLEQI